MKSIPTEERTLEQELIILVTKRWPKISYKDCMAFVQEITLELPHLREVQVKEDSK